MIWAGIVLYNPDLERLKRNIDSILPCVDGLTLFNNGVNCQAREYINTLENEKVNCIGNGTNRGIAYALNRIMDDAKVHNAKWVITFDQDSITPRGFVNSIRIRIEDSKNEKLGVVCPLIVDKRRIFPANRVVPSSNNDYFVEMCITSGSCTSICAWEDVGKFDEYLFIDLVDNDFCKRLRNKGWKILRMANVELDQEFGNIQPRNKRVVDFFSAICAKIPNQHLAVNISKLAYKKKVSPMRVYYTNRNIIYLNEKLKDIGGVGYESYNVKSYLGFIICFDIPSFLRSNNKIETIKAIIKGIKDGKSKIANM